MSGMAFATSSRSPVQVRWLLFVLAPVVLVGCQFMGPAGVRRDDIGSQLHDWTTRAQIGDTIAIADLTDFAWERLLVAGPYTSNDDVQKLLGFAWDIEKTPAGTNDANGLIAFVSDHQVAAWSDVGWATVEGLVPENENAIVVAKDAAVFAWNGIQLVPTGGQAWRMNADARTRRPGDALGVAGYGQWSPVVGQLSATDRPSGPA